MGNGTCDVPGCTDLPRRKSAQWCNKHYFRWYRHGDPLISLRRPNTGTCHVDACERPVSPSHRVCSMHRSRYERHGNFDSVIILTGRRTPHPAYRTAHKWVAEDKGRACERVCDHCGVPAADWAYDHEDPDELVTLDGLRYSRDSRRYIPLCKPCHGAFDATERRRCSAG